MSETPLFNRSDVRDLQTVLEILRPSCGPIGSVELYKETAKRLSEMANKSPEWGWRYVRSVAVGSILPGKRFADAVSKVKQDLSNAPMDDPQIALAKLLKTLGVKSVTRETFITCMEILVGLQRQEEN